MIVETVAGNVVTTVVFESFKGVVKMGEMRVNLSNFIVVGLMAFIAVWLINRGLDKANLSQYKA